jgi:hypothetical protein
MRQLTDKDKFRNLKPFSDLSMQSGNCENQNGGHINFKSSICESVFRRPDCSYGCGISNYCRETRMNVSFELIEIFSSFLLNFDALAFIKINQ